MYLMKTDTLLCWRALADILLATLIFGISYKDFNPKFKNEFDL
jgi:hypothetical protein